MLLVQRLTVWGKTAAVAVAVAVAAAAAAAVVVVERVVFEAWPLTVQETGYR